MTFIVYAHSMYVWVLNASFLESTIIFAIYTDIVVKILKHKGF